MRWKSWRLGSCIYRSVAIFLRFLPVLPAILAPVSLLYILDNINPKTTFYTPLKIKVHLSDDSYIRNVLHEIDMPAIYNNTYGINKSFNGMNNDEEEKINMKKLEPYIKPKIERLRKGSTRPQVKAHKEYLRDLDIMSMRMPAYLPEYKNPCWRETYKRPAHCVFIDKELFTVNPSQKMTTRCLPYFYIIGQPKCGTTDIYNRLGKHPDITLPKNKEPYWLNRRRFFKRCSSLSTYTDFYHEATSDIESSYIRNMTTYKRFHHKITGDGSVDIMWDNHIWSELPGNRRCKDPCYTNADYLRHINPEARIIVALRDPVERVYSDYMFEHLYLKYTPDKLDFHKRIVETIYRFRGCLKKHSLRYCVYDSTLESALSIVRPLMGIYHVHLEDWLRVFPRDQIHVIRFEDYITDTRREMERLFRFLSLGKVTEEEMESVMGMSNINKRPASSRVKGDMNDDTRAILHQFYYNYNKKLAALLNDDRYLWVENHINNTVITN